MVMRARYSNAAQYYLPGTTPILRIANAVVTLMDAGTSSPFAGTIYAAATGGTTLANPFTTDAAGRIEFYLDAPIPIKVQITKPSDPTIGTLTVDFEPVMPDPRDIVTTSKSGFLYLLDYAGGLDIGNDSLDGTFAFQAALDAAVEGQTILVPPGIYRIGEIGPLTGCTLLAQAGGGFTSLKRKSGYSGFSLWNTGGATDSRLIGFTVDGNAAENNGTTTGNEHAEIDLGGSSRNTLRDVTVIDWNHTGIWPYGQDNVLEDVTLIGQDIAFGDYLPTTGTGASKDYGSLYGTNVSGVHFCDGLIIRGLRARRIRSAGVVLGGTNMQIDGMFIEDTHRQYFNYEVAPTPLSQGGGQFATTSTRTAAGVNDAQRFTRATISGLHIGPGTNAPESGIDMSNADDIDFIGVHIEDQAAAQGAGMSFIGCNRIRVIGGETIRTTLGGYAGIAVTDCTSMEINGHDFKNQAIGIYFAPGTNANNSILGLGFSGCTQNLLNSSSDTNFTSLGHRVASGPAVANVLPGTMNHGSLTVPAGTVNISSFSASASAIAATAAVAGGIGATITAASGAVAFLNTTASAALNAILGLQRSGVLKASLGLDASDNPTFLDSAGAALLAIDKATGRFSGPGVAYTTFTPTVEQPATNAVGVTTNWAEYAIVGKTCFVHFQVTYASGTATAGAISVKPGVAGIAARRTGIHAGIGHGSIYDSSAGIWYQGKWVAASSTVWNLLLTGGAGTYAGTVGQAGVGTWSTLLPAFTFASGDVIEGTLAFELA